MNKEVLAVDVDEVLMPFLDNFLLDYNAAHGTDALREQFGTYDFDGPLGLTVPETIEQIYAFTRTDHSHIDPIEGAEDAIERLYKQYDLEIVTARHSQFEVSTWGWIQAKLPDSFRAMKMIGYAPILEKPVTKAKVCQSIGAVALIDDSLKHVSECADEGIDGVLFGNYPWNKTDILPTGVVRCNDWQEVAEYFNV